jgi:predicted ATPase
MDSITIKGYKSLRNFSLKLDKINILIGANGSGKSNFLSFFEFLNAIYERRLSEYVALRGGADKFLWNGSKVTDTISAAMHTSRNRYSIELKEGENGFVFTHEYIGYRSAMGYIDNDVDISSFGSESKIRDYDGLSRAAYIKRYLSGIKKYHFHDTGQSSPFTKTCNVENDKYFLYGHGDNLAAFLLNIRENSPKTYLRILGVIQSVAPYFSDFYFFVNENGGIRLQWKSKYSEAIYGPQDLSDGTIRFIALTTLFLQPNPPEVIIIDEPELGLHPFAIGKLSGLIKSAAGKGSQVIIATQSAELISNFDAENIITVDQHEGETTMKRLDTDELEKWLDSYTLGDLWKQSILKGGQPR